MKIYHHQLPTVSEVAGRDLEDILHGGQKDRIMRCFMDVYIETSSYAAGVRAMIEAWYAELGVERDKVRDYDLAVIFETEKVLDSLCHVFADGDLSIRDLDRYGEEEDDELGTFGQWVSSVCGPFRA